MRTVDSLRSEQSPPYPLVAGYRSLKNGMLDAEPYGHLKAMLVSRRRSVGKNTDSSRTEKNAQESLLLCLPAELRNRIYEYVVSRETIDVFTKPATTLTRRTEQGFIPEPVQHFRFLQVCRQLYSEACLLPFSTNIFRFAGRDDLCSWRENLLEAQKDSVHYLQVKPELYVWATSLQCLRSFPALEKVYVVITTTHWEDAERDRKPDEEKARKTLRAYVKDIIFVSTNHLRQSP